MVVYRAANRVYICESMVHSTPSGSGRKSTTECPTDGSQSKDLKLQIRRPARCVGSVLQWPCLDFAPPGAYLGSRRACQSLPSNKTARPHRSNDRNDQNSE